MHPLPHCVRLLHYLKADLLAEQTTNDILAFVNPARQSDMDEHPLAVVFILEALRRARARDTGADAHAGAVFDATRALLPSLVRPWSALDGVSFDLRSLDGPRRVDRARRQVEDVLVGAEEILSGPLGQELGEDGLRPWFESGILLGPDEQAAAEEDGP